MTDTIDNEVLLKKKDKFIELIGLTSECNKCKNKAPLIKVHLAEEESAIHTWYECNHCDTLQGIRYSYSRVGLYKELLDGGVFEGNICFKRSFND